MSPTSYQTAPPRGGTHMIPAGYRRLPPVPPRGGRGDQTDCEVGGGGGGVLPERLASIPGEPMPVPVEVVAPSASNPRSMGPCSCSCARNDAISRSASVSAVAEARPVCCP